MALALAATLGPAVACAQNGDDPTRRRLILQAGALRDRGDHQAALERAREAAARRMSPSLRLFIAEEERALGQIEEALHDARRCAAEFEASEAIAHRAEFLGQCQAMVEALSQRVGRLIVRVEGRAPSGLTVTVRGVPLAQEEWGTPWELLPGPARVEAQAPSGEHFGRDVSITAGTTSNVHVELTREVRPLRRETPEERTDPVDLPPPPTTRGGSNDLGRWALLGGAGAAFVGAAVFYGLQGSALGDRDALCQRPSGACVVAGSAAADEATGHQDRAQTYNTLANVSLALGALAAAGGLVWWAIDWRATQPRSRIATILAAPVGDGAWVGVRGAL